MYDRLHPDIRRYVDALVDHARTSLWPERRVALESFRRGIAKSAPAELEAFVRAADVAVPPEADPAETTFRLVLTAYLERLAEPEITNPDQAALYARSLDETHVARARRWFARHPEHPPADE